MNFFNNWKNGKATEDSNLDENSLLIERSVDTSLEYGSHTVDNSVQSSHSTDNNWDLIMVFPYKQQKARPEAQSGTKLSASNRICSSSFDTKDKYRVVKHSYRKIIGSLKGAGLQTHAYYSVQEDEVYVQIRCPLQRLREFAEQIHYKLEIRKDDKKGDGLSRTTTNNECDNVKQDSQGVSALLPCYGPYKQDLESKEIYIRQTFGDSGDSAHPTDPFSQLHRIKLTLAIITSKLPQACGIAWHHKLRSGELLALFPLHNSYEQQRLREAWMDGCCGCINPRKQPLAEIRHYFGEKIALYFAFVGHYTSWLTFLAAAGALCVLLDVLARLGIVTMAVVLYSAAIFSMVVAVWGVCMIGQWVQKEALLALQWGMDDFEKEELERPEYHLNTPNIKKCPVTGKTIPYFPPSVRRYRRFVSYSALFLLMLTVLGAVACVYLLQVMFSRSHNRFLYNFAPYHASVLMAVQINIFSVIYNKTKVMLNDWENHRTETAYADALITKTFMFQFVNSYASLYYTAFLKRPLFGCDYGADCMTDLAISLGGIFVTQNISSWVYDVILPGLMYHYKHHKETQGTKGKKLSPAEEQYLLYAVDTLSDDMNKYAQASVQFGYVTLFVAAFPSAPILAYFSNLIHLRVEAVKMLTESQRAIPRGAQDIGNWQSVFTCLSMIAIVTNGAVIVFTSGLFSEWDPASAAWVFILSQYAVYFVIHLFGFRKEIPDEIKIQNCRNKLFVSELVWKTDSKVT